MDCEHWETSELQSQGKLSLGGRSADVSIQMVITLSSPTSHAYGVSILLTLLWLQLCCLIHHLNNLFDNIVVFVCDRNICCLNHLFGFPLGSARTAAAENIEDGN